jgi:hypothetical protein
VPRAAFIKGAENQPGAGAACVSRINSGPIRFPISSPQRLQRLDRPDHHLEFKHFAGFVELDQIDTLELPFSDIGAEFQG